jgi:uncharacterized RDD family membrane protein YckC
MTLVPPSFLKRVAATWIDFVLLLGTYLLLGFLTEHLFQQEAYPPPRGMQLYSERDFDVFWFFVHSTAWLVVIYLGISYRIYGATLGQRLLKIRILNAEGGALSAKNILLRILVVLFRLFLIAIPGPLIALLFLAYTAQFLNEALSLLCLLAVVFGLICRSYVKYRDGRTRSIGDRFSQTICVDLSKTTLEQQHSGCL